MKALVWRGIGEIALEDVPEPRIEKPTDAIVRLTRTAICGTDLHFVRGTMSGMEPGTILGHEGVGVVEHVGPDVRNLDPGDRVVIGSTIACGYCSYCRAGYYSMCDNANPHGARAGAAFFGGPRMSGPFNGMQAERVRVPFAAVGAVKLPDEVSDEQAIMLSDIFPTGYFGADNAEIEPGNSVAVFGAGPVGQFAIMSALLMNAGRVIAVDTVPDRLAMARKQGAETVDYNAEDPVEAILRLTGGIGVDRAIDAVGVDANHPSGMHDGEQMQDFRRELQTLVGETQRDGANWHPGDAPSQVLTWAVEALAKAGTLSVIGVYPQQLQTFPLGSVMHHQLTVHAGDCNHRRYIPTLLELTRSGAAHPELVITQRPSFTDIVSAYEAFDRREPGWLKAALPLAA